jgi:predicted dehydrogenase
MVAFSHRFISMNAAAKKLLAQGAIGKPYMIRVRYAHGGPYPGWAQSDWFYKKEIAVGGAVLDMGIHALDICQYLIGPIQSVMAENRTLRKKIEVDDNSVMILDFGPKAKCLGYIEVGWTSKAGFSGIEVFGDNGCMTLDLVNGPSITRGVTNPDGTRKVSTEPIQVPAGPSHWPGQMVSWVHHVLGKKTAAAVPGVAEGVSSLAAGLAAMESSRTGKRVIVRR